MFSRENKPNFNVESGQDRGGSRIKLTSVYYTSVSRSVAKISLTLKAKVLNSTFFFYYASLIADFEDVFMQIKSKEWCKWQLLDMIYGKVM